MRWEISILQYLESIRSVVMNIFFQIVTITAESGVILLGVLVTYWCINKKLGRKMGFIMLFSSITNSIIKMIIKAPRPFQKDIVTPIREHTATGYSFPSGHTQAGTTLWVLLMDYFKSKWIYYLGIIMIFLIALSRLYLGVHWPKDVIVGILMGIIAVFLGNKVYTKITQDYIWAIIAILITIITMIIFKSDHNYIKMTGAMVGFILGIIAENRYIAFKVTGSLKLQMMKFIIGFLGLGIIMGIFKTLLPSNNLISFTKYTLLVFWVTAGAPYFFKKIENILN